MSDMFTMDEQTADRLREIGNIGTAHAASALSAMLRQPVRIQVPRVELVPMDRLSALLGGVAEGVACVDLALHGDVTGSMFFIQTPAAAKRLIAQVLSQVELAAAFTAMELSALGEMGNLMSANYLASLASFTGLHASASVPRVRIGLAQEVLDAALHVRTLTTNYALVIHTRIQHQLAEEEAHFFLLPEPGVERTLLAALGVHSAQVD